MQNLASRRLRCREALPIRQLFAAKAVFGSLSQPKEGRFTSERALSTWP